MKNHLPTEHERQYFRALISKQFKGKKNILRVFIFKRPKRKDEKRASLCKTFYKNFAKLYIFILFHYYITIYYSMFNLMTYYKFWSPTKTTSFWVKVKVCRFFLSFLYICIAVGDPIDYQEGRVGIPLNGHIFFFRHVPSKDLVNRWKRVCGIKFCRRFFIVYASLSKILGRCTRYNIMWWSLSVTMNYFCQNLLKIIYESKQLNRFMESSTWLSCLQSDIREMALEMFQSVI